VISVPGLAHPNGLAVHSGLGMLFVTSRENDQIFQVRLSDMQVINSAATGAMPWDVAVNERIGWVYVSNSASNDVWIYDAANLNLVAKVGVGPQPGMLAILPDISIAAVVTRGNNGIAVLQGQQLVHILGAGLGAYSLAADRTNHRLFVANRDAQDILVYDRQPFGAWLQTQRLTFSDRRIPFDLAFNSTTGKLYSLYVINLDWAVDVFTPVGTSGIFLRQATIPVGDSGLSRDPLVGGAGLAVNPVSGLVVNVNTADNTLSLIDGGSNQVRNTLDTGNDPFSAAIDPSTGLIYISLRQGAKIQIFQP